MSVRILSAVWRNSRSAGSARLVLLALADSAHNDGVTWVPQQELVSMTRLADSTVREALRTLVDNGEVVVRLAQRGRKRLNVYRVVVGEPTEVEYDRLPFKLLEAFPRPPESGGGQTPDDRRSSPATTAGSPPDREGRSSTDARDSGLNRKRTVNDSETDVSSSLAPTPPKLVQVDGRNLGFDSLAGVCGIGEGSPRMREVAAALNGSAKTGPGIREQYFREVERDRTGPPIEPGPEWEREIAYAIQQRAVIYIRKFGADVTLTPLALAKWWTDLPGLPDRGRSGGLSPEEIVRSGREDT